MERKAETVDLSIIIVNWNTRDHLRACLQSIYAHPPSKYTFEVIVVDNASADGSVDMVRREFPEVRVIANDYNYGFAKATNQGYRISRGRYVMTLNPDTEVFEGTLDGLVEFLDTHPDAGAVVPGVIDSSERFHLYASPRPLPRYPVPSFMRVLIAKVNSKPLSHHRTEPFKASDVWGTGITCRREALRHGFFFEERTFMFSEELWLCWFIREAKWNIYALPSVRLRHVGGASWRTKDRIYVLSSLRTAAAYAFRSFLYGRLNAKATALLSILDNFILYAILIAKFRLSRPKGFARDVILLEYSAKIRSSFGYLLYGDAWLRKCNREAERLLNGVIARS
jgi:GT2 family glycosyltransferase